MVKDATGTLADLASRLSRVGGWHISVSSGSKDLRPPQTVSLSQKMLAKEGLQGHRVVMSAVYSQILSKEAMLAVHIRTLRGTVPSG